MCSGAQASQRLLCFPPAQAATKEVCPEGPVLCLKLQKEHLEFPPHALAGIVAQSPQGDRAYPAYGLTPSTQPQLGVQSVLWEKPACLWEALGWGRECWPPLLCRELRHH